MTETAYENFLRSKVVSTPERGIAIDPDDIHPWLKPHAKAIVRWALQKGNAGASLDEAAILRGFGGTKTFREFMRLYENGQVRYKFVATATRAQTTPSPANGQESSANTGNSGMRFVPSFATFSPNGCCWKTSQGSLIPTGYEDGDGIVSDEHGRNIAFLPTESEIRGVASGTTGGMDFSRQDQLRSLGNLVVTQQGACAITLLLKRTQQS